MKTQIKKSLTELFHNKIYITAVLLIAVAAFGFAITHVSIGIDDFGVNQYMNLDSSNAGNMLQQGRLVQIVFHYIVRLADVIPFLNSLIGTLLLTLSAILFIGLIDTVAGGKFSTFAKIIFSGLYISNSVLSFKFTYDLDVVVTMFSYACIPVALIYGLCFIDGHKKKDFFLSALFLLFAIGSYESFNAVYVCAVLFVLIVYAVYRDAKVKELCIKGLQFACILLVAFVVYYALVKIFQACTGNIAFARANLLNSETPLELVIKTFGKRLLNRNIFFAVEFTASAMVSVIAALYFTIKKRNALVFFLFAGFGFFALAIQMVQGYLYYRSCQTFNLFVACIALLLMDVFLHKRVLKQVFSVASVLLMIWQLKDMNLWFYQDWANYQKNVYALHSIATDLNKGYDVSQKPVCFLNRDYNSFLMSWDAQDQQEIGESPIIAAIGFLGNETSPELIQLFKYQGYDFIKEPTPAQMEKARAYAVSMAAYPNDGYMQEYEDIIVVKLGK